MRLLTVVFVLALAALTLACEGEQAALRVNTVVLVDFSDSVSGQSFAAYVSAIKTSLLAHFGPTDRLVIRPIDRSSEQRAENLFVLDLKAERLDEDPSLGLAHRDERLREVIAERVKSAASTIESQLTSAKADRARYGGLTDILGAVEAATAELDRDAGSRNLLVILSDMVQETPECNVTALRQSGETGAQTLLARVSAAGRLPDLTGVRFFALGPGEGTEDSPGYFRAVKKFWLDYAAKAGAQMDASDYGFRNGDRLTVVFRGLHVPTR